MSRTVFLFVLLVTLLITGCGPALLKPPAEITVRKAEHSVRLIRMQGRTYFDLLRAKLLWGQDVRSVRSGEKNAKR